MVIFVSLLLAVIECGFFRGDSAIGEGGVKTNTLENNHTTIVNTFF